MNAAGGYGLRRWLGLVWQAANLLLGLAPAIAPVSRPQAILLLVGAPRSGTTVFSQILAYALDCAYVTNLHAACYGAPWMVEALLGGLRHAPGPPFTSRHGSTTGIWGCHETGRFWYRFFPVLPQAVGVVWAGTPAARRLARQLRALASWSHRPVLVKNTVNSVRLAALMQALPEAVVVWVRRDLRDNARSLLAARKAVLGTHDVWFSVQPHGWQDLLARSPAEQVVGQVRLIEAQVAAAVAAVDPSRLVRIDYAQVCEDPLAAARTVVEAVHRCRLPIRQRPGRRLAPLSPATRPLDGALEAELDRAVTSAAPI